MGIAGYGALVGAVGGGSVGIMVASASIEGPERTVMAVKYAAFAVSPFAGAMGGSISTTMICGDKKFIHKGGHDD